MTRTEKFITRRFSDYSRLALVLLLSVSVIVWSVVYFVGHTNFAFNNFEQHHHAENATGHSHSHSTSENIWWAFHGHGHDKADHDHNTFYIHYTATAELRDFRYAAWILPVVPAVSFMVKPPERPPRI